MIPPRARLSRRLVMYLLVGVQVLALGALVAWQEINIALDPGVGVDLEIADAQARKDPFRGAYVSGRSTLDLAGRTAALPAERLRPGEKVLVFFAVEAGGRPRIVRVERRRRGGDPPFAPTGFSIPGRVLGTDARRSLSGRWGGLVARVGDPAVPLALELPDSVPVDASALDQLAGPSLIRASLRRGFLGHRFLADVRLIGRGWPVDASFAWDERRERLVVLAPRQPRGWQPGASASKPRTEVFFLDALGKEAGSVEVAGRLVAGVVAPDGGLLAVGSEEAWSYGSVFLAEIREDGRVARRSPPLTGNRVLGLDAATGAAWVLTGRLTPRPEPPHYVEPTGPGGPRGPRLGPFASVPSAVVAAGAQVWVVETSRHRVTRLDRASGRIEVEYRDLNAPAEIAVDAGALFVIEADRTQLTRLAPDGRVLWRVPRFEALAWILPEPGSGGAWVGASRFEGGAGGVFRVGADGRVARLAARVLPATRPAYTSRALVPGAVRDPRHGRLYVREGQAIVILGADGTILERLFGFRYAREQRIRG